MISKKYEFILFAFLMALFMAGFMSFIVTLINVGFIDGILHMWLEAYWKAFLVAFPTIILVVPQVRKIVGLLIKEKKKAMSKENLLIVISTNDVDSILKFPLLYGGVSLPRGYWKRVHVMFWGSSILPAKENEEIKEQIKLMQKDGVEFSSCIVCAEEYNVVDELESMGIECNHTGLLLTESLQNDKKWSTMTI